MYPRDYFSMFPAFPRKNRAFVAMSFDQRADARWQSVLAPAIRRLEFGGNPVEPFRVDLSKSSDAILTEILEAIADCAFVVADVSAFDVLNNKPVRNSNVLYEVGIAHAVRLPQEVILFRSDNDHLDFDISGVRVHTYNPDGDPAAACEFVADTIVASLQALEGLQRAVLRSAAQRLTRPALVVLIGLLGGKKLRHPEAKSVIQMLAAIERADGISLLLEIGAMQAVSIQVDTSFVDALRADPESSEIDLIEYEITSFGRELMNHVVKEMGILNKDIREALSAVFARLNYPPLPAPASRLASPDNGPERT